MMVKQLHEKIITVRFFKTPAGNEPVRDWLKKQTAEDKKTIGEDIKAVEFLWPLGYPQVVKLDTDLWEVRTNLDNRICRIFFTVIANVMVLLHGMIKKDQKTPKQELELAKKRRDSVLHGGFSV
jgi:phage-related protein